MTNPPGNLKLAIESVCTVLGHCIDCWKTVWGIISVDNFTASFVNFNADRKMAQQLPGGKEMEQLPMAHSFDFIGEEVTILAANIENFLTSMAKITRITISKTGKIVT
ncbi:hypothetical protein BY996DRAFT_6427231 [Phakopsora pachyrhizi]|nr:hypothetical protein BY996DRAFT_6427231 [Phakopsora pachyrhizi]